MSEGQFTSLRRAVCGAITTEFPGQAVPIAEVADQAAFLMWQSGVEPPTLIPDQSIAKIVRTHLAGQAWVQLGCGMVTSIDDAFDPGPVEHHAADANQPYTGPLFVDTGASGGTHPIPPYGQGSGMF